MISLSHDHVVVEISNRERACDFYARVLGAEIVGLDAGRKAARIGDQKLNLPDQAARTGAMRPISSAYIRDPDGNLIEISNPRAL